jgi:hypothetical protein
MAKIEVAQLGERLSDDEIVQLAGKLEELGAPSLPKADDGTALTIGDIDDDIMTEFLERLDAHDCAAEIYLPMEFEDVVEVGGLRVGSAPMLLDVLEEMRDELHVVDDDLEEEEYEDEDEDEDDDIMMGQLRSCWKLVSAGASSAMDKHLPMLIAL